MTPEQWKKIDDLLDAALDLPPERHDAFLDEACEGDEELRREMESLLAAHQKAGSFIETTPAKGMASALDFEKAQGFPGSLVGQKLGHYQVAALLGAGGMGEVYRARDSRLDRNVAIKVLPAHLSSHPDAMARFEREAKAVAALSHPNILAIHDFGYQEGMAYLVMELLEGATLRQRMKSSVLNWREAVKIASSIADGLAAAHVKGIIHRDIKPENIFLTNDGLVKILDFGIARVKRAVASNAATLVSRNAALEETKPGTLMGTIGYMSPEQVRGESVEAPGDIFSLGCMLIEMLTGERPFSKPTAPETLAAILRDDPPVIDSADQDIPVELDRMVRRCLEKNPEERFQSARDLALDLRSLLTSSSGTYRALSGAQRPVTAEIQAQPTGSQIRRPQPSWHLPVIAIGLLAVAAVTGWMMFRPTPPPQNSIAILPFTNNNKASSIDYLCDGIPESVTISLARIPQLRVMGWNTVKYLTQTGKEANPQKIGKQLDVHAIVLGNVSQNGDVLTISVEMLRVKDGTTIWGYRYDVTLAGTQKVPLDIARDVSGNLLNNLSGQQPQQLPVDYIANTDAYQSYLQGRHRLNQRATEWSENLKAAISYFNKAVEKDKGFALAYAGLADAYVLLDEDSANTIVAANKALKLDPQLVEPKVAIAFARAQYDWDWQEAEKGFIEAIKQNPHYATAHHWYAEFLTTQGRFNEAMKEIKLASSLDPFSMPISVDSGIYLFFAHRFDEAIIQFQKTLELDPDNTRAMSMLSASYEQNKDYSKSVDAYDAYLDLLKKQKKTTEGKQPDKIEPFRKDFERGGMTAFWRRKLESLKKDLHSGDNEAKMRAAYLHSALGEKDKAMKMLEAAYRKHYYKLCYIKVDPRYDNLRNDPSFIDLNKRVGF